MSFSKQLPAPLSGDTSSARFSSAERSVLTFSIWHAAKTPTGEKKIAKKAYMQFDTRPQNTFRKRVQSKYHFGKPAKRFELRTPASTAVIAGELRLVGVAVVVIAAVNFVADVDVAVVVVLVDDDDDDDDNGDVDDAVVVVVVVDVGLDVNVAFAFGPGVGAAFDMLLLLLLLRLPLLTLAAK